VAIRGIRGATTVEADTAAEIIEATTELLDALVKANDIEPEDVAGAWFTTTKELHAEYPAIAARKLGWTEVPLLCGMEMDVDATNPRSIPMCIRVMVLLNCDRAASDMTFIYLRRAEEIKADLDDLRRQREADSMTRDEGLD
jgi:chorismate mutase